MQILAQLFYGTSAYPTAAPTVDPALPDMELAKACLAHMMKHAGGHFSTMATGVKVSRHPAGMVNVNGNGWSVTFLTPEFKTASLEAGKTQESFLAFIQQITSVDIALT